MSDDRENRLPGHCSAHYTPGPRPQAPTGAWGAVLDQTPGGLKGLGSVSPWKLVTEQAGPL